jgi:hypothetical protein
MSYEVWGEPDDGPELPEGWLNEEDAQELRDRIIALEAQLAARATAEQSTDTWISVKDRLPDFDIPVVVAWDKAPWRTDGEPSVDDMLHARNNDSDGWLWYTVSTGDLDEWDTEDMPTHWMALPAIKSQQDAAIESQRSEGETS